MAILDLLVLAVILISMLVSVMRGFMYEAAMIFGWVLAFFIAKFFAPELSEVFAGAIGNKGWRMGAAFSLIFIAVLFANSILAFFLKSIFSKSALRPMDRLLGSIFGLLRAAVVLTVVALVVHILRLQDAPWWVEARSAPVLDQVIVTARPHLRTLLNLDDEKLSEGVQMLNQIDHLRNGQIDDDSEQTQGQGQNKGKQTPNPNATENEQGLQDLLQNLTQQKQQQQQLSEL